MHAEILDRLEKSFENDAANAISETLIERVVRKVIAETKGQPPKG